MTARVLVVDDDESIRAVTELALVSEGYEVRTAPHGAAALRVVANEQPDVILLDMRMPVMDGWEFARVYRETPGPHAPIITVTAASDARAWAAEIGAAGVLAKPFDIQDLITVVDQHAR
ncbi:MAG: response regulator [Chloroflexi bacterium]|nr:response regulator [Chloroflexota bacterium]